MSDNSVNENRSRPADARSKNKRNECSQAEDQTQVDFTAHMMIDMIKQTKNAFSAWIKRNDINETDREAVSTFMKETAMSILEDIETFSAAQGSRVYEGHQLEHDQLCSVKEESLDLRDGKMRDHTQAHRDGFTCTKELKSRSTRCDWSTEESASTDSEEQTTALFHKKLSHRKERRLSSHSERGRSLESDNFSVAIGMLAKALERFETRKVSKPLPFDVEDDRSFMGFLRQFENYAKCTIAGSKNEWRTPLGEVLTGDMKIAYDRIAGHRTDYDTIIERLYTAYKDNKPRKSNLRDKFNGAVRSSGESLYDYSLRLETLWREATPNSEPGNWEELIKKYSDTIPVYFAITLARKESALQASKGTRAQLTWRMIQKEAAIEKRVDNSRRYAEVAAAETWRTNVTSFGTTGILSENRSTLRSSDRDSDRLVEPPCNTTKKPTRSNHGRSKSRERTRPRYKQVDRQWKTQDDDDDSDEYCNKKEPAKKEAGARGGGDRGGDEKKQSGFIKSFKLSPELADVVGSDVMPRHEVVNKLWAVIKERKLQDPKNKQYAICDDQLMKVFGIKRFLTFGMIHHLKDHFLEGA